MHGSARRATLLGMMNIRAVGARAELVCPFEQGAMGDTHDTARGSHQATCCRCARSSPILRTTPEAALATLEEMGWTRTTEGADLCPICRDRAKPLRRPARGE
jgi:hypothetical protein